MSTAVPVIAEPPATDPDRFAFHLAKRSPRQGGHVPSIHVRDDTPQLPPSRHGLEIVIRALHLPQPAWSNTPFYPTSVLADIPGAPIEAWEYESESGVLLPRSVARDARFQRELRADLLLVPSDWGFAHGVEPDVLAMEWVAWRVITKANPTRVLSHISKLLLAVDAAVGTPALGVALAPLFRLPDPAEQTALLAHLRVGSTPLDPRALRWVMCELAAALQVGSAKLGDHLATVVDGTDADVIYNTYFRVALENGTPTTAELTLALALLSAAYEPRDREAHDDGFDHMLGSWARATSNRGGHPASIRALARTWDLWTVEGDDPAMIRAKLRPADLREAARKFVGVPVDTWYAGSLACGLRLVDALSRNVLLDPFAVNHLMRPDDMSRAWVGAFVKNCTQGLNELGTACLDANPNYSGLGSLPISSIEHLHDRPCVWIAPRHLALTGFAALMRRFGETPFLDSIDRSARGHMFEAQVERVVRRLDATSAHIVIGEEAIKAASRGRGEKAADLLVLRDDQAIAIEASLADVPRSVVGGNAQDVRHRQIKYLKELKQADSTADRAGSIAATHGLPRPRHVAALVVCDEVVPQGSPMTALSIRLDAEAPRARHYCSIDELEEVIGYALKGMSFTGAVLAWQWADLDRPLSASLDTMARLLTPPDALTEGLARRVIRHYPTARRFDYVGAQLGGY